MTRRVLLGYLTIAAFVLLVLEIPLGITFARGERERLLADVERDAVAIAARVEDMLQFVEATSVDPALGDYPQRTGARVVITDAAGVSVYDSDAAPGAARRDFSTRPEIRAALAGEGNSGFRSSETLGADLLFVAIPITSGGEVHGAVRITAPSTAVDVRITRGWLLLGGIALVVLAATAGVGLVVARGVTRPVREVAAAAEAIARGDLDARARTDRGPPEIRELVHRFNQMAERLAELIASQQAFVADASHQLRSPLAALRLELESLEPEASGEVRDGLVRAVEETGRLARIVEGQLLLARADGARPQPTVIDVAATARDRQALWSPLAEERDVRIEVDAAEQVPALAVAGHLDQILDNLIANALEVAPGGTAIELRVTHSGDQVEIHVVDEGPGMTAEQREHAFDRFWRAAGSARSNGSGLGLPIARQLARAGGGDLRLGRASTGGLAAVVVLQSAR